MIRESKKILIYGAGSIGIFLGTKLFYAGFDTNLFGRRKMKKLHDSILINDVIYDLPPRIYKLKSDSFYDVVFVTTKLYDSAQTMKHLKKLNITFGSIVFIQNGLVQEKFYGDYKQHPGFATISIFEGYRLIENQLWTTKSTMGWQTENTKTGKEISEMLQEAKINCVASPELDSIRVEKMMLVNAVGPLSAIEKKTLGELIDNKETKKVVDDIFEESFNVLRKKYKLPTLSTLKKHFYRTIKQIKPHYSSMYQDLTSGRKTEIEYLSGFIVTLGKEEGLSTSVNDKIYKKIKILEKKNKN